MNAIQEPKRKRLSVGIEAYPDVARMLERALRDNPGVSPTHFTITALRKHLTQLGYARKKDVAAAAEAATPALLPAIEETAEVAP